MSTCLAHPTLLNSASNYSCLVTCMKLSRFLGGHAKTRTDHGCNWLVECLCPDCEDRELWYLEDGGRVLTIEEFYEHCGGGPCGAVTGAWRTKICVKSIGEVRELGFELVIGFRGLPPSFLTAVAD